MKEIIDVNVSFDTSFEDIELLRQEMEAFVRSPENSRDFQPDIAIGVGGIGDLDKLTLKIAIKHKSNWHNEIVRATRRSKFMCALTLALKKVPIYAPGGGGDPLGAPSNPSYSVAVTDEFAASARAKSESEKEAKKLANQKADQAAGETAETAAAEHRAVDHLNASNPVAEALEDWGYENTLNSRDPSTNRDRAAAQAAAAASRSPILSSRESQRGRRKAGETLPPMALGDDGGMPAVQLTQSSGSNPRAGQRSFDVERQAGIGSPPPPARSPYNVWTAFEAQTGSSGSHPQSSPQQQQHPSSVPSPAVHLAVQQPGSPPQLQSPPQGRPLVGARARGASVSGVQQPPQGAPHPPPPPGSGPAGPSGRT